MKQVIDSSALNNFYLSLRTVQAVARGAGCDLGTIQLSGSTRILHLLGAKTSVIKNDLLVGDKVSLEL
jgi:hypothetical protein